MAGRDDFGILRSEILADRRAHRAADLYVEAGIASIATAYAAVCGHVALLGLWAMRETDDGVLPDDGVLVVQIATMSARDVSANIVRCLTAAELLRPVDEGLYLVGFRDCYGAILDRREANKEANRIARAEAAQARRERAEKLGKEPPKKRRAKAPATRDAHVSDTSSTRKQHVSITSGPTGRAVPAVPSEPDGTERPERPASSQAPDPPSARVAALASEADAAPRASVGALSGVELDAEGLPKVPPPAPVGTPEYERAVAIMRERARIRAERVAAKTEKPPGADYQPPDPAEFERRRKEALERLAEPAAQPKVPAPRRRTRGA